MIRSHRPWDCIPQRVGTPLLRAFHVVLVLGSFTSAPAIIGAQESASSGPTQCPSPTPPALKLPTGAWEQIKTAVNAALRSPRNQTCFDYANENELAAILLAPAWCETVLCEFPRLPAVAPGRSDEVCRVSLPGNERAYAAWGKHGGDPCAEGDRCSSCCRPATHCRPDDDGWDSANWTAKKYARAYFHAAFGPWQTDTINEVYREYAAFERTGLGVPDSGFSAVLKHVIDSLYKRCWRDWFACGGNRGENRCETAKNNLCGGNECSCVKVAEEETRSHVYPWKCLWQDDDGRWDEINCWLVDVEAAAATDSRLYLYKNPGGTGDQTPLSFSFINFRARAGGLEYEYRLWPRAFTGYDTDIWARRKLGGENGEDIRSVAREAWSFGPLTRLLLPSKLASSTNKVDVVLLVDTTGSMWDDINQVAEAAQQIVDELFRRTELDVRVAVAEYKDFPFGGHGAPGDMPYRAIQPFTKDKTLLQDALSSLPGRVGGGGGLERVCVLRSRERRSWPMHRQLARRCEPVCDRGRRCAAARPRARHRFYHANLQGRVGRKV